MLSRLVPVRGAQACRVTARSQPCKKRGFCPSCTGRRMADVAAHLVDEVFPAVPGRQWVCSLPWRLRYAMGYDRKLCADVLCEDFSRFVAERRRNLACAPSRTRGSVRSPSSSAATPRCG